MFGDNSVKYMNIELGLTSVNYDDSGYGFDWGNTEKGSKLLASAILAKIGTPTIARVYADKYTRSVIQKLTQDSWSLEAMEVAKWINENTDHTIDISTDEKSQEKESLKEAEELELKAKEERRIEREKQFQQEVQKRLKEKETREKLKKAQREKEESDKSKNAVKQYEAEIKKYKNEIKTQQHTIKKQENEIDRYKQKLEKYQKVLQLLDIPALRKKFTTLDEIEI